MNELFLLDKKIDLHNGANYSEWQTLRVVKPSVVSVEGEMPDIISVSISQRPKEDSKGISNALSFDMTPKEAEDLILSLQGAINKEKTTPYHHPLIGKKTRLTDKAIINLELNPPMRGKIGKIQDVDIAGYCTILFADYDVSVTLKDYTSAYPDFEIIEE
jgi:hypothetical protein